MKEFELSRYIKKWLPLIVFLCIGLTVAVYLFLSSSRMYVASAVIHYNDENAEKGLTPIGTELDVNEIRSSSIMSRVLLNLGLTGTYSVDDLLSRVSVTEVIDKDEEARKEALLDEGEEYTYEPTTYIVSFEAENKEGEAFARQVLDELLDQYFADYSEKYVNSATVNNTLSRLNEDHYDYIEMLEIIDEDLTDTISTLNRRSGDSFRSTKTGMTFDDLANEVYLIQSVRVSALFSEVLDRQITRDKNLLISDYSTRIQNNSISNLEENETVADVVQLMDAYVTKMRNSDNTNITYEYILDEVYEKDLLNMAGELIGQGDQTVTYDKLIFSWRDHSETREYAVIDSAYCQYIINVFSEHIGNCGGVVVAPAAGTDAENPENPEDAENAENAGEGPAQTVIVGTCSQSDLTCSELSDPEGYAEAAARVEEEIEELVQEMDALYEVVYATNTEYNEYRGAESISMLSTSSVEANINVALYTAIAAVFLLIICCGGAVLLGRLNDIIRYAFYTDHMTGMYNRIAFDAYLKERDRKILDNGVVCTTARIVNQMELNRAYGREAGDAVIRLFADSLREAFRTTDSYLVYNGNSQFIVMTERTDYVAVQYMVQRFRLLLDARETLTQERITYEVGFAETSRSKVNKVRELLSRAAGSQEKYESAPVEGQEEQEDAAGTEQKTAD